MKIKIVIQFAKSATYTFNVMMNLIRVWQTKNFILFSTYIHKHFVIVYIENKEEQ